MGVALGEGLLRLFASMNVAVLPGAKPVETDWRVLGLLLLIAVGTGIGFGLVPAFQASLTRADDALKMSGRGMSEGSSQGRFRMLLLGSEYCLAFLLLIGAGLMIRSLQALYSISPGFNPDKLLTMTVSVAGTKEAEPVRRATFYDEMLARTRALPGVKSAALVNHLPIGGDVWGLSFLAEGQPTPDPGNYPHAVYRVASPGYFETMQITLKRGRGISADDRPDSALVVVVNESFANQTWPGEDAIGKRVSLESEDKPPVWRSVVGVVKDVKQGEWAGVPRPEVYLPFLQDRFYTVEGGAAASYMTLVLRTERDPVTVEGAVQATVREIDRNIPISEVRTMNNVIAGATAQPRLYLFLLVSFASLALVMASVGIYGVVSYAVSRRTQEIGVRVALGATEGQILGMVLASGMRVVLLGGLAGVVGALLLGRVMSNVIYGVQPHDPATFVAVSVVLTTAAMLASLVPARRATRVDPMTALRHE